MSSAGHEESSDVYLFLYPGDLVECCDCVLTRQKDWGESFVKLHNPAEVAEHIQKHVEAGHKVPEAFSDKETSGDEPAIPERN